jgi:hypothetical protein
LQEPRAVALLVQGVPGFVVGLPALPHLPEDLQPPLPQRAQRPPPEMPGRLQEPLTSRCVITQFITWGNPLVAGLGSPIIRTDRLQSGAALQRSSRRGHAWQYAHEPTE